MTQNESLVSTSQIDINRVLSEIASALVGQFEMSRLLDQVVNVSMSTLSAEVCSIFLEDKERDLGYITMRAGSGFAKPLVEKARYALGEGFTGYAASTGKKFNLRSREELESLTVDGKQIWQGKHDRQQWRSGSSEFRNLIALPLKIKDEILGVIKVENKHRSLGDYFTDEDERYFETIANVVALAIENARLHERVENQLKAIAAKASHRIGNQLANYDGIELDLLDEAAEAIPDRDALTALAQRVSSTTRGLKRMVEEFKQYGKPLQIEKRSCDVAKIIHDEVWHSRPPESITIAPEVSPDLPHASIDAAKFGEALKELLKNALRAIQGAGGVGTIIIRAVCTSDARLDLSIHDTGPGFPDGFPVFEPFQTTNPESTGLGLATVKELVEAHGGKIVHARSDMLKGACVRIEIPI